VLPHDDPPDRFPAFATQHASALRRYFKRAVGSVALADDLTQDVFLRVVRAGATFEPRGRDRAWLFTIAHNVLVEHLRRDRRRGEPVADGRVPVSTASQVTAAAVHEALRRLPDDDRHMFLLAEVAGLTYDEIARVCGATHGAVRSRVFRARLALREILQRPDRRGTETAWSSDDDA
jgi:RNA polymerase sigma-70 factor (ECF subfamily)